MQDFLVSVMQEDSSGLYVCELPTGYGKTYNTVQAIAEYVKNCRPERKVLFLTTLKKNLPDDSLRLAYGDDELYEEDVLRIRSNMDEVCEKLPTMTVPEMFRTSRYNDLFASVKKYNEAKNANIADKGYLDELRKRAEQDEVAFRSCLAKELNKHSDKPEEKLALIHNNSQYKWIGELYPAVFTSERKILLLSINKFLQKNSTIIEPSYDFLSASFLKNAVIVIDEFDATKNTVKDAIIEKSLKLCDEYMNLFRQIVSHFSFETRTIKGLPRFLQITCHAANSKVQKDCTTESLLNEARNIINKYHVDLNFKTVGRCVDRRQRFLMKDATFHSLLGKAHYTRVVANDAENKVDIYFEDSETYHKNATDNDISLYALLRAIDRFFFRFHQLLKAWAEVYAQKTNEGRADDEPQMTSENAFKSILNQFRLTHNQRLTLENEFINNRSLVVKEEMLPDNRFYLRGMKIFEFTDSDDHNEQTYFNLIEVIDTPEKIMLCLAQKATVIGLSATACFPTAVGNYDLEFLEEKLGENFHKLPEPLFQRIKADLETIWAPYREDLVKVHASAVDGFVKWIDAETCCRTFLNRENAVIAGNIISNKTDSEYYQRNYCQILSVMRSFVGNPCLNSLLCLGMQTAKPYNPTFESGTLRRLYELALADAGVPAAGNSVFFLGQGDYDSEKKAMCDHLAAGEKLFIISSYATVGAGQNLQYDVADKTGFVELTPYLDDGDKRHFQKDIDAIYLGDITHLAVNTYSHDCISKEELLTMLFQIQELRESSELYFSEAEGLIKLAFRAHTSPDHMAYNKLFHVRSIRVTATLMILQAVGRMCRTFVKNPDIYIYVNPGLLQKIEVSELKKRILPPEMEAIVQLRESVGTVYTEDDKRLAKRAERISSYIFWDVKKYLSEDWTELSMASYNELRILVLCFPTASEVDYAEHPYMKRCYITSGSEQNTYLYSQIADYDVSAGRKQPFCAKRKSPILAK